MEARRVETGPAWLNAQRESPVLTATPAGHALSVLHAGKRSNAALKHAGDV